MKSPLIILFIIFNLLAVNIASAMSMYDGETSESHHVQSHDDTAPAISVDDTSCDHLCHFSAHMVGLISQTIALSTAVNSTTFINHDEQFHSIPLHPPTRPPRT